MNDFFLHAQLAKDTFFIKDLKLSKLLLMNDRRFPWVVLVPRHKDVRDMIDLLPGQQKNLFDEVNRISLVMRQFFNAEKLNVATIGNIVPQLHVHVVARFANDAAWPKPVWGYGTAQEYEPQQAQTRVEALRRLA